MKNASAEIQIPSRSVILDIPGGFIYYKPVANNSEFYSIQEIIEEGAD